MAIETLDILLSVNGVFGAAILKLWLAHEKHVKDLGRMEAECREELTALTAKLFDARVLEDRTR